MYDNSSDLNHLSYKMMPNIDMYAFFEELR